MCRCGRTRSNRCRCGRTRCGWTRSYRGLVVIVFWQTPCEVNVILLEWSIQWELPRKRFVEKNLIWIRRFHYELVLEKWQSDLIQFFTLMYCAGEVVDGMTTDSLNNSFVCFEQMCIFFVFFVWWCVIVYIVSEVKVWAHFFFLFALFVFPSPYRAEVYLLFVLFVYLRVVICVFS